VPPTPSHWQDALEPQFVQRLTRPLWRPGITNNQLATRILGRAENFHNRLPLLTQQKQRWGRNSTLQVEPVPIVYAQPISAERAIATPQPSSPSQLPLLESITLTENSRSLTPTAGGTEPLKSPNIGGFRESSKFTTSGVLPIQAKFDTPQKPGFGSGPATKYDHLAAETGFLDRPLPPNVGGTDSLKSPSSGEFRGLSDFTTSGAMPLQAKLETPQKPGFGSEPATKHDHLAAETGFMTRLSEPLPSPQFPFLEFALPVVNSTSPAAPYMEVPERPSDRVFQGDTENSGTHPATPISQRLPVTSPALPIVTPRPLPPNGGGTEPNPLPIVAAIPIASSETRSAEPDYRTEMVVQNEMGSDSGGIRSC
jgi:hypothetical protein